MFPTMESVREDSVSEARGERVETAALRTRMSTLRSGNLDWRVETIREADDAAEVRGAGMNSRVPGGYCEVRVAAISDEVE